MLVSIAAVAMMPPPGTGGEQGKGMRPRISGKCQTAGEEEGDQGFPLVYVHHLRFHTDLHVH